jgi:hypothetical protein
VSRAFPQTEIYVFKDKDKKKLSISGKCVERSPLMDSIKMGISARKNSKFSIEIKLSASIF